MNTTNTWVPKLNKAEIEMINKLPEALRSQVSKDLLATKTAPQGPSEIATKNRTEFSVAFNDCGVVVVRGLGNRFPVGIRYDSFETLFAHSSEIQKCIADAKAYVLGNPEKVKAAIKARSAKRREETKNKKQS